MANTLTQYYSEQGLSLPSVSERSSIATKAGIKNYTGSIGQNAQLLDYLTNQGPYVPATTLTTPSVKVPTVTSIGQNGTDISRVEDVSIVPSGSVQTPPMTPTPTLVQTTPTVTVLRTTDNADGTSTNYLSDGTTDTGVYSNNPISGDPVRDSITKTESEIRTIESRMANRSSDRNAALGTAGVFEDMRRLNELNATLRAAQDRQIEIPIESRQELRGRGATVAELQQQSAPQLENAVLNELVASRQSTRLADAIKTNIAQVDSFINAENERDNVIYTQKNRYLTQLQTQYSNILSARQQALLEDRKYQNEAEKEQRDWDRKLKKEQLDLAINNGATPEQIQSIVNGTATDAIVLNTKLTGNVKADAAQAIVSQIDDIINSPGLDGAVGTNFLGRVSLTGDAQTFKGKLDQFFSQKTLDSISELKAKGVSLGALSDSELSILAGASLPIRRNKNGGITMNEEAFKNVMNTIKSASQKTFIASALGAEAARNYKNAAPEVVAAKYNQLISQQVPSTVPSNTDFGITQTVSMTHGTSGNLPQRNNNPGNVKKGGLADSLATGTDSQGHLIFATPEQGFQALALDLNAKISGKSRFLPANPTLAQLGGVYAEDGKWANNVSKILGVPVTTPTATIPLDKLLAAVARQEGFFA